MSDSNAMRFASATGLLLVVSLLLFPSWQSLAVAWNDVVNLGYTHGYLVLALSVWLLFRRRSQLHFSFDLPLWPILVALLLASFAWLLSYRASIEIGYQMLLPVILWLAVLAVLGPRVARAASFPIAYLYFAIPVWDYLMGPLQAMTVAAVGLILEVLGVANHIQGNIVTIPEGRFEIAGGCGGLHFFIVALALGALVGEMRGDPVRRRMLLLAMAGGFALLANWLRVSMIIIAGHKTNMQHSLITHGHYYFGWWVFAAVMAVYFFVASRLDMSPVPARDAAKSCLSLRPAVRRSLAVLAVLAVAPAWDRATAGRAADEQLAPPAVAAGSGWTLGTDWNGDESDEWRPLFSGVDVERRDHLEKNGRRVLRYWASYANQRQGKELVGGDNSVLGAQVSRSTTVRSAAGIKVLEQVVAVRDGRTALVWSVYEVDGHRTTSGLEEQLIHAVQSLRGPAAAAVLALRAECRPDCDTSRRDLDQVMKALQSGRAQ